MSATKEYFISMESINDGITFLKKEMSSLFGPHKKREAQHYSKMLDNFAAQIAMMKKSIEEQDNA